MLKTVLSLRVWLILVCGLFLIGCTPKVKPLESAVAIKNGALKCPLNLATLPQLQKNGLFLECDPDKDGMPFAEESQPVAELNSGNVWLFIDTKKQQLAVKRGEQTLALFENIAIGRNGAGVKMQRGDNMTPIGEYKIGWVNPQSKFHVFYGLTYPSVADAREAVSKGIISDHEYEAIVSAHQQGRVPPQNTALGGQVGIHGLGHANEAIHRAMNWTQGCVALTNRQIEQLDGWIAAGMRVSIR